MLRANPKYLMMGNPLEIALRMGSMSEFGISLCLAPCLYGVLTKCLLTGLVRFSQRVKN